MATWQYKPKQVREILEDAGALLKDDHFLLASGKHSAEYINKDALYPYVEKTADLCDQIAHRFRSTHIDAVVAPAVGGVILSQWVAWASPGPASSPVLAVYAEKEVEELAKLPDGRTPYVETGRFIFDRGYDELIAGKSVLVVEDILTTGGSVRKVVDAARAVGAEVVGVGALVNRGRVTTHDVGDVFSLQTLLDINLASWDPSIEVCPQCRDGIPINRKIGHGKKLAA
jgi:orotate phosphoribosyltransferase